MNRKTAREVALQMIFELGFSSYADPQTVEFRLSDDGFQLLAEEGGLFTPPPDDDNAEFIRSTVRGVLNTLPLLDEYIHKYAEGWAVERVSKIAKAILRLALYEMKHGGMAVEIAINEAVELAKRFDADESSPAFINGILGSVARAEL